MTDWYADPWTGSSNNDGDSWTIALSGTDGVSNGTAWDQVSQNHAGASTRGGECF